MHWTDEGFVLGARRHGESAAVVHLLTREHGRHAGLVHGAFGRSKRGLAEPGNRVAATWQARLEGNLGTYALELVQANAADLLAAPRRLLAVAAACAVADGAVPEREPHPALFDGFSALVAAVVADDEDAVWPAVYVRFELGVLQELGFRLELDRCAATGDTADLIYVSPRSGRAVSRGAGAPYKERLLTLPSFITGGVAADDITAADIAAGLSLTGHFLARHVFGGVNQPLPATRQRLAAAFDGER